MEIKTFRAKTMPQALELVRRELGPEAMVLHTRELHGSLLGRVLLGRQYEIAATHGSRPAPAPAEALAAEVRTRLVEAAAPLHSFSASSADGTDDNDAGINRLTAVADDYRERYVRDLRANSGDQLAELQALVQQLRSRTDSSIERDLPPALFDVFTDLIEADVDEETARDLVSRLRRESADLRDGATVRGRIAHMLQAELRVTGPIDAASGGRVVALVGPTGVGKTTTIAKLAANYRLRDNRRVGLITVDTYRIAAVEQLRTYADIIDLPMEVVSSPREMREAVARMRDFDLVLMDTAGRSPRDEVKIRELRSLLAEAAPDEVHLVVSAASSARSLSAAAEKFSAVGVTSLVVTKLDEATALGNLLTLARKCRLPFSYLTDGQNVPDDIAVADARTLASLILGVGAAV